MRLALASLAALFGRKRADLDPSDDRLLRERDDALQSARYWKSRAKSAEGHLFASDLEHAARAIHAASSLAGTAWDALTDAQRWSCHHHAHAVIVMINGRRLVRRGGVEGTLAEMAR